MIESPLELLENYDEKQTKLGTETTQVDPGLDSPEELCAETLEAVEAVEENIKSVFESNDPVEDVLAFILTSIIDYAQLGWEFISGVVNTGTKIKLKSHIEASKLMKNFFVSYIYLSNDTQKYVDQERQDIFFL